MPAAVLTHLKKLEPSTWEKSVVYHNRKDQQYLVEIRADGHEKTYRFAKDGKLHEPAKEDKP
ncbi:MAG TPA: hypothetical protein VEB86_13615 [Chryseosolibacter sp.]|nr:hypothetical protein [Chryseosolibacter sp.]